MCPPPPAVHPLHRWLTDRASLTARLQRRCGQLTVKVLSQQLTPVHRDESLLLGTRPGQRVVLREVLLLADGNPVVYARSLLARHSLRRAWGVFAGIGNRPLGAALFADPQVWRGPLTLRRLDGRDSRYARACAAAGISRREPLWARRSAFVRHGEPLVVCEVFLPAIRELRR
ncbi:chorismate lyase [Viridibacterium curvum]|uniref:Probable chorismate pyruvate-lyase n=2 Tax=Viridibacterium curvum TaxID=1101404 RepID=A0ABP9R407_9RHOO